ncbi:helix-turn-helix domain-containing protein [Parvularcula sp. IMCC14364]|uniref:helix-turn-helix domain-containing protein n=1 Tax=Parvularcula sp. IMCC14364 TaxID=3067902 RepID=UPI002740539C|nr:helix-turn-helix domain-containing protein [Parvularcula sp. IMCC14364]
MENQPDWMKTYDQMQILWRDACAAVVRDIVADAFDIAPEMIHSKARGREYVARARMVAMYMLHTTCRISQKQTGQAFERSRNAVSHACARVEDLRDDEYADIMLDLMARHIKARVAEIGVPSLQAVAEEPIEGPAADVLKARIVGGEDMQDLPLIKTASGKRLQVVFLK